MCWGGGRNSHATQTVMGDKNETQSTVEVQKWKVVFSVRESGKFLMKEIVFKMDPK